jgi:hypothetical protein
MKTIIRSSFVLLIIFHSNVSSSNELMVSLDDGINSIINKLDYGKTYSIKLSDHKDVGLEDESISAIISGIENSLLKHSDFKIKLINRYSLEEVWSEAVEPSC